VLKCIYCLKDEKEVSFQATEHILPKMFGDFKKLVFKNSIVCRNCNTIFSGLETEFLEDSLEGLMSAVHRIVDRSHIRLKMNNLKIKVIGDFEGSVFERIFPQPEFNASNIAPRSLIVVNNKQSGFNVFWLDKLANINPQSHHGKRLIKFFSSLDKKDINIVTDIREFTLEQAYKILANFGVPYKEKTRKSFSKQFKRKDKLKFEWEISESTKFSSPQTRIFAKTALNFFAYNALQSNSISSLYSNNFQKLREFVLNGVGNDKTEICSPLKQSVIREDQNSKGYYFGHTLTFSLENGYIVSTVSFFGLRTFKIVLGKFPFHIQTSRFGGGHFFCPLPDRKKILELNPTNIKLIKGEVEFGLYRR